jgi:hypothetical protein
MEVSPLLIAGLLIALLAVFTVVRSGTQFRPAAHQPSVTATCRSTAGAIVAA